MKFYPPVSIRFFYRWALAAIFAIPLATFAMCWDGIANEDRLQAVLVGIGSLIFGGFFLFGLLGEQCFAILHITQTEIIWKCPFRRTMRMKIAECIEIGSYWENNGNGIPKEKIYFSDHKHAKYEINKKGILPISNHCIKFWYSKQLRQYVVTQLSPLSTGKPRYYRFEFNHDHP